MKSPLFQERFSLVDKLIILLLVSFVIRSIISLFGFGLFITNNVSLSVKSLSDGFLWTVLSYASLHEGPLHLIFNLLGIHFIGRSVSRELGSNEFILLSVLSTLLGGISWLCVDSGNGILIGASALVCGYLSYFCLSKPNQPISFLLFFILPLTLRPKIILYGVIALEVYGFLFNEISQVGGIAHSAHLGGIVAGILFFMLLKNGISIPVVKFRSRNRRRNHSAKTHPATTDFKVNFATNTKIHEELDRILDKINEKGFGSLTDQEKAFLDKAKSNLQK